MVWILRKHSFTKCSLIKCSVISSVQYTLTFITSFFIECLPKIRTFYDNNMILWYHLVLPKVVLEVLHGLMDTITRTKTKTLPFWKIKRPWFFRTVYHNKKRVIPHPVIAAILDVILNILQSWKTTTTSQSNSPNATTNKNYQKIVIYCDFDFRLNFTLKGRPSWTPS